MGLAKRKTPKCGLKYYRRGVWRTRYPQVSSGRTGGEDFLQRLRADLQNEAWVEGGAWFEGIAG